jgi:hypothetical protein
LQILINNLEGKNMKKIGIILAALVIMVVLFSCAAQHKCDAYSSVHRDKVEKLPY